MSSDHVPPPGAIEPGPRMDYAAELNPQQLEAVTAPPGPCLVIAGAGSGKTRTLTFRVAWLLDQGIPPDRILLLTFTNKAAREMMGRVADLAAREMGGLWGGTFHSVGNRILRLHHDLLGYPRDFTVLDREDARHFISACMEEAGIETRGDRFPKADELGDLFSLAANTRVPLPEKLAESGASLRGFTDQIVALHESYARRKRSAGVMDFDDLLVLWLKLMREHDDVRELYQRRFQFLLVDEYQDTNRLQSDIIDLLAARHHNLMVVGDDAQSIYAWRGANFRNILEFPQRYPQAKVYRIETNYRSTPEILSVANAAIVGNRRQFTKVLSAARKSGMRPVRVVCDDASQQAAFVAHRVLQLHEEGSSLAKMAVLYRSHFHALELQLELTRRHIPFSITSGIRFFEQAHIKDVTAFLKFILNPRDELAFRRMVLMLPGVGPKGADKLWRAYQASLANAPASGTPNVSQAANPAPMATALQGIAARVPRKAAVAWAQFVATISQLEAPDVREDASAMIRLTLEAGYKDYLKENHQNHRSRLEDIEQLGEFAGQFVSVAEFLTQLALLTNVEAEAEDPAHQDEDRLRLSTIHQAKGLEFDIVFVIMLCDGLFPSQRSLDAPDGEEEERRLMYVAITRARNELYLTRPLVRLGHGSGGDIRQKESRFLREIPPELLDTCDLRPCPPAEDLEQDDL